MANRREPADQKGVAIPIWAIWVGLKTSAESAVETCGSQGVRKPECPEGAAGAMPEPDAALQEQLDERLRAAPLPSKVGATYVSATMLRESGWGIGTRERE